ncbi:hypothetical protein AMAG_13768 [Allomyces macrogynus ATCC 38327]|uniref:Uncharacterized protein n=1 Tax=Allomyces macrogynus (strain ATCC 38327) TaxID=578462 RepID=A0A0L0T3J2_ALLM3|nr:hypothetical protein AMAG_13768 [Allomyces macrogynus ATCC 38327]|eukprot:KNE69403.1 hypothetical protein AMAG_13768 [Allomyces macrogynus ATCC 38327]
MDDDLRDLVQTFRQASSNTSDTPAWTNATVIDRLSAKIRNSSPADLADILPFLTAPLITVIESTDPAVQHQGLVLLAHAVHTLPPAVLRRSNRAGLFWDLVTRILAAKQATTWTRKHADVVDAGVAVALDLVRVRHARDENGRLWQADAETVLNRALAALETAASGSQTAAAQDVGARFAWTRATRTVLIALGPVLALRSTARALASLCHPLISPRGQAEVRDLQLLALTTVINVYLAPADLSGAPAPPVIAEAPRLLAAFGHWWAHASEEERVGEVGVLVRRAWEVLGPRYPNPVDLDAVRAVFGPAVDGLLLVSEESKKGDLKAAVVV